MPNMSYFPELLAIVYAIKSSPPSSTSKIEGILLVLKYLYFLSSFLLNATNTISKTTNKTIKAIIPIMININ